MSNFSNLLSLISGKDISEPDKAQAKVEAPVDTGQSKLKNLLVGLNILKDSDATEHNGHSIE